MQTKLTNGAPQIRPVKIAHTIPQTVQCSGLSRSSIYDALKNGRLKARKAGRRTLIEDAELRRFIEDLPVMGSIPAEANAPASLAQAHPAAKQVVCTDERRQTSLRVERDRPRNLAATTARR